MNTKKEEKIKEFLENPEGWFSDLVETTMNRSGCSYSKVSRALGLNRDALYKFANREAMSQNIQGFRTILLMMETGDLTLLVEVAGLFGLELVPQGTMQAIKTLPDALSGLHDDERLPLYRKQPKRPLLRAMMEEASEK